MMAPRTGEDEKQRSFGYDFTTNKDCIFKFLAFV
jgi:hypothetical protein